MRSETRTATKAVFGWVALYGTLTLSSDGKATATRIETFDFGEAFEVEGRGTRVHGHRNLDVRHGHCPRLPEGDRVRRRLRHGRLAGLGERGTPEAVCVTHGDPDDGAYYALLRRDP